MSEPEKKWGGARPGSGRKRDAAKAEHTTLFDAAWVMDRRYAAIARVAKIIEHSDDEDMVLKAFEMLFNRVYGKPTERKELTGADGGPIELAPTDYRSGLDALRPDDL